MENETMEAIVFRTTSDDKVDNVSYELANFCKQAVGGNVTCLEVFFSDQIITTSAVHEVMQKNWRKFFDTKKFIAASKGYARGQRKEVWADQQYCCKHHTRETEKRIAKCTVAYLRVLWQCEQFLKIGKFECSLTRSDLYPLLKKIRHAAVEEIPQDMAEIRDVMENMEKRVGEAETNTKYIYEPDIGWVENFILEAYTEGQK